MLILTTTWSFYFIWVIIPVCVRLNNDIFIHSLFEINGVMYAYNGLGRVIEWDFI